MQQHHRIGYFLLFILRLEEYTEPPRKDHQHMELIIRKISYEKILAGKSLKGYPYLTNYVYVCFPRKLRTLLINSRLVHSCSKLNRVHVLNLRCP